MENDFVHKGMLWKFCEKTENKFGTTKYIYKFNKFTLSKINNNYASGRINYTIDNSLNNVSLSLITENPEEALSCFIDTCSSINCVLDYRLTILENKHE